MTITPLENYFYDLKFQCIFRAYYAEVGINLRENTALWDEIKKSADEEGMVCLSAWEGEELVGFIMLQSEPMTSRSGFFSMSLGFIRELWVAPAHRRSGLGRALIQEAEVLLRAQGALVLALTPSPAAEGFYAALGFSANDGVRAKNGERVLCREIRS